MANNLDCVALGECLVEMSELDKGECAGLYRSGFAGDVLNTLFYAARLGMKTGLVSSIGTDHFTRDLVSLLQREEIDLEIVPVLKERPNGLYITKSTGDVEIDGAMRQFSFWRNNSAARETFVRRPLAEIREYVMRAQYFHFSAIAVAILKDREKLFELLASISSAVTVSFDTNVRTALWDSLDELKELLPLLARFTRILFVTDTDDRALFGARASTTRSTATLRWVFHLWCIAVVRLGAKLQRGSRCFILQRLKVCMSLTRPAQEMHSMPGFSIHKSTDSQLKIRRGWETQWRHVCLNHMVVSTPILQNSKRKPTLIN